MRETQLGFGCVVIKILFLNTHSNLNPSLTGYGLTWAPGRFEYFHNRLLIRLRSIPKGGVQQGASHLSLKWEGWGVSECLSWTEGRGVLSLASNTDTTAGRKTVAGVEELERSKYFRADEEKIPDLS